MVYVLYNTFAGAHYGVDKIRSKMLEFFKDEEISLADAITVEDKRLFVEALDAGDRLVIVGGDGTLNRFVNSIEDREYSFPIYCYAGGTGNDFINDVQLSCRSLPLEWYFLQLYRGLLGEEQP